MSSFSQSTSRLSTPTRAITTTLAANRSSPPLAPSTQTYLPLVRSILRHRMVYSVFLYSVAFCWVVTILLETFHAPGGLQNMLFIPFMPQTLFFTALQWAGTLPLIVLRKANLSNSTHATSPAKTLKGALGKGIILKAFIVYASCAGFLTFSHCLMAHANEKNPRLSLFVKSKKHPYYLNARVIYVSFAQLTLAMVYMFRNIMLDRFMLRRVDLPHATLAVKAVIASAFMAVSSLVFATVVFGLMRMTVVPVLFRLPLVSQLLRPFAGHFLRASSGYTIFLPLTNLGLIIRTFFLVLFTAATWECTDVLFGLFISQPVLAANMTPDPFTTLISAISNPGSESEVFLRDTYAELASLSSEESASASAARTALFGDQRYNPSLWSTLTRESLLLLGNDYQHLLRRGKPAPPPVVPTIAPIKPAFVESPGTPLIRRHIFKSTKDSPISEVVASLASDGAMSRAVNEVGEEAQVPELFRSVEAAGNKTVADVEVKVKGLVNGFQPMKYVKDALHAYSPPWVKQWSTWWTRDRLSKAVEACVHRRELDAAAIEALSTLVCASLTEDRYGVVQRDIPKIIEALTSFLTAVEDYQLEINAQYTQPEETLTGEALAESERMREEVSRAGSALRVVSDALKDGIARIGRTFGDKLRAFKFPPRTARKLQGFVDYI